MTEPTPTDVSNAESFDLEAAHKHCGRNRSELERSRKCGCFHCLSIFDPATIVEWCDEGDATAICPECDIDSVIGDQSGFPITDEFLTAMHSRWFETTYGPGDPEFDELFGAPLTVRERVEFFFDRFRRG